MLVYSMGSLYTSIVSILAVPRVGEEIAALRRPKVLLLNAHPDRETTTEAGPLKASDYVHTIMRACRGFRCCGKKRKREASEGDVCAFVTHLFVPERTLVPVDTEELGRLGIRVSFPRDALRMMRLSLLSLLSLLTPTCAPQIQTVPSDEDGSYQPDELVRCLRVLAESAPVGTEVVAR
eukprot:scaffold1659_cov255-Pinguiococcus_pyrenoidosus.AAC.46